MSEPLRTRVALDAAINVMSHGSAIKRWIIVTPALRAALGTHYRGFKLREAMNAPILAARRRVEARIGQLLGEPINGSHDSVPFQVRKEGTSSADRHRFRTLARSSRATAHFTTHAAATASDCDDDILKEPA
jgi:hypothetical protein